MSIFIRKHPHPSTLLAKSYGDAAPEGYEPSTEEAAAAWVAEQLAAGWVPVHPAPAPVSAEPLRFTDWLSFVGHLEAKVPGLELRLVSAARQSDALMLWLIRASGQGEVFLDHPQTIAGFAALVSAQVITQAERDLIFTP
jgi:hypothetical protein